MAEAIASEVTKRRLRRWSDEEKRAVVELSLEPGASVKEVAACFGVSPTQLYAWRRELRDDAAAGADAPLFLPAVVMRTQPLCRLLPGRCCPRYWWRWRSRWAARVRGDRPRR